MITTIAKWAMPQTKSIVEVVYVFRSPAAEVFDAWLDPELLARWLFDPAIYDQSVIDISLDPNPGAEFAFRIRRNRKAIEYRGKYLCIERPNRLTFTWAMAGHGDETLVKIEIQPLKTGCRLKLEHDLGDVTEDTVKIAKSDWEAELASLGNTLNQ